MILNLDCIQGLALLPDKSVDSIISDPPYGMNLQPQRGITKAIANDGASDARELWAKVIPETYRIAKDDTAHIFFSRWSEPWVKPLLEENFNVKGCIAWVKNNFGIGYYLRPQWELAFYCHKGKPPKAATAPSDVWHFPKVHRPSHSCEKPVELMRAAVRLCMTGRTAGLVVDPFAGVGSTGVAAKLEGHQFIGYELDEMYAAIANFRFDGAA